MRAVTTIFPVIFMIGIGTFSRIRGFTNQSLKKNIFVKRIYILNKNIVPKGTIFS